MKIFVFIFLIMAGSLAFAVDGQQRAGTGTINRMIVNHNGVNDEIYVTLNDGDAVCSEMKLRSNNPGVTPIAYNALFSYMLAAKLAGKVIELYTDPNCRIFRAEIKD